MRRPLRLLLITAVVLLLAVPFALAGKGGRGSAPARPGFAPPPAASRAADSVGRRFEALGRRADTSGGRSADTLRGRAADLDRNRFSNPHPRGGDDDFSRRAAESLQRRAAAAPSSEDGPRQPEFAPRGSLLRRSAEQGNRDSRAATAAQVAGQRAVQAARQAEHLQGLAQRNFDNGIRQAEHMRSVGERTGNETLIEAADRAEAQARAQYERRMQQVESASGPRLGPPAAATPPSAAARLSAPLPPPLPDAAAPLSAPVPPTLPSSAAAPPLNLPPAAARRFTPPAPQAKPRWTERVRGLWPFGRRK